MFLGISFLFSAGGTEYDYYVVKSSGVNSITFNHTSNEVYVVKYSTMEAFVNWTSTDMPMITYTTNYFKLPETESEYIFEHTEELNTYTMSIYQPFIAGTTNNIDIRLLIKYR